jgi:hypothetical protein
MRCNLSLLRLCLDGNGENKLDAWRAVLWCQSRGAEIKLPPGVEAEIKLPPGVEAEIKLPPGSGAEIKLPPGDGAEITKCGSSSGSFLFTTDLKKLYRKKSWLLKKLL